MIQLFQGNQKSASHQSSKGNQLKWKSGDEWYKADYMGYEGLAEYVVSSLLRFSDLDSNEFLLYETEEILYNGKTFLGCKSRDFLQEGWQMVTLERLFFSSYGVSFYTSLYKIERHSERFHFLADETARLTGLKNFGQYLSKLMAIDALFLNEDRHLHNVAVLLDPQDKFHYCPIFDNGACLLSDVNMDYPMETDISDLLERVHAKTFCDDFFEQVEIAEDICGQQISFDFGEEEIRKILESEKYYPQEYKARVMEIILDRKRAYRYLFR